MSKIGVSNFHYARQTTEETASAPAVYETPVAIPGLVSVDVQVSSNTNTLYADNGPFETASSLGEINLTVDLADIPLEAQAALLGHTLDSTTADNPKLTKKSSDVAPYCAVLFEFLMADGKKRCVKLYKGKFAEIPETGQTRGENVDFQTTQVTASFVQLKNNKTFEDIADFAANATTDGWYTAVLPS